MTELREVSGQSDEFHLQEIWSPGAGVDLKKAHLATWHMGDEQIARPAHSSTPPTDPVPYAPPTEGSSRGRTQSLVLASTPKYDRRHDLSGVHFRITSINVSSDE